MCPAHLCYTRLLADHREQSHPTRNWCSIRQRLCSQWNMLKYSVDASSWWPLMVFSLRVWFHFDIAIIILFYSNFHCSTFLQRSLSFAVTNLSNIKKYFSVRFFASNKIPRTLYASRKTVENMYTNTITWRKLGDAFPYVFEAHKKKGTTYKIRLSTKTEGTLWHLEE